MIRISARLRTVLPGLLLGFALAAGAQQTTSTSTGAFEILAVQGNTLVVRNASGTHEYTVPSDFPFVVDGRTLTVSDLRAGMKGTATVTTQVTVIPVYVTEIRNGEVLSRIARTLVVKADDGRTLRFTQTELDERGVQIYRDGKELKVINLNAGDQLSARVVTRGTPEVLTEQQVAATLANSPEVAAAAATAAPEAAAAVTAGTTDTAEAPAPDAALVTPAAPAATGAVVAATETPAPAAKSSWPIWLLAALALALVIYLATRKPDKAEAGK